MSENDIDSSPMKNNPIRKNSKFEKLKKEDQFHILSREDNFIKNTLNNIIQKKRQSANKKNDIIESVKDNNSKTLGSPDIRAKTLKLTTKRKNLIQKLSPKLNFTKLEDPINLDIKKSISSTPRHKPLSKLSETNNKIRNIPKFESIKSLSSPNLKFRYLNKKESLHEPDNLSFVQSDEDSKEIIEDNNLVGKLECNRNLKKMQIIYDSLSDEELENSPYVNNVLSPNSFFKYSWDFLIFILINTSIIIAPLSMAFIEGFYNQTICNNYSMIVTFIDLITDIIFLIDLMLNFFIGYYDAEDHIICNQRKVVIRYLGSFFTVDLISAIPFNTLIDLNIFDISLRWLKLLRLIKYFKFKFNRRNLKHKKIFKKLLKKLKISKLFSNMLLSDNDPKRIRLIRYILDFVIMSHIFTCIWIYVSLLSPGNNWTLTQRFDKICNDFSDYYVGAIYFTMCTFFTIGYGDIHSISIDDRLYNIFLLIIGLILYSFFVSYFSNFAIETDPKKVELDNHANFLKDFSYTHSIEKDLYRSIKNYFKYNFKNNREENNEFIFQLPKNLRNRLITRAYADLINNFQFLRISKNTDFNVRIILALRPICAYKNEKIMERGNLVEEIIFIRNGRVKLFFEYKKFLIRLITLYQHEHFGDYYALKNERPPFDLTVTSETCELYLLRKQDFFEIIEENIDTYSKILKRSLYNTKKIQKLMNSKKKEFDTNFEHEIKIENLSNNFKTGNFDHLNSKTFKSEKKIKMGLNIEQEENWALDEILPDKEEIKEVSEEKEEIKDSDMFKFKLKEKSIAFDDENILKKQIKKINVKKNDNKIPINNTNNSNDAERHSEYYNLESNNNSNYSSSNNLNSQVENSDDKMKVSYNYNYYNNYNITNSGNLFINLNLNEKKENSNETFANHNQPSSNVVENRRNTFLQFSSNNIPLITINENNSGDSDSNDDNDSERDSDTIHPMEPVIKNNIFRKSLSLKNDFNLKSKLSSIGESYSENIFTEAKMLCNDHLVNKDLKKINSQIYAEVVEKLDIQESKKLNERMDLIYRKIMDSKKNPKK